MCLPQRCACSEPHHPLPGCLGEILLYRTQKGLFTCGQVLTHLHACVSASGRFLVSHGSTFSTKFLSDVLSKRFTQFKFPAGEDAPSSPLVDNSKARFHTAHSAEHGMHTY